MGFFQHVVHTMHWKLTEKADAIQPLIIDNDAKAARFHGEELDGAAKWRVGVLGKVSYELFVQDGVNLFRNEGAHAIKLRPNQSNRRRGLC